MSKSYSLTPGEEPLKRYPGERLVAWANRRLRHKGRTDIEWYEEPGGSLRLRSTGKFQSKFDFDTPPRRDDDPVF